MLRSANQLKNYTVDASDGLIGDISGFYFDDETWTVRYLVVDAGSPFDARQVLISPIAVSGIDDERHTVKVKLTREKVRNSPPVDSDQPVSRQYENRYYEYYAWIPYWWGVNRWGASLYPWLLDNPGLREEMNAVEERGDAHLRSMAEVEQYAVHARDGELGSVDDFLVQDDGWGIRYLVIDTGGWLPGRRVLLSPLWVNRISFGDSNVDVDLPRDVIRDAPLYEKGQAVTKDYEERLFRYYGSEEYLNCVKIRGKRPVGI